MDPIVAFYNLTGTDHRGRTLEQMWTWDDETLEAVHDYIQWMFPTERASAFNADAPRVSAVTRAAFAADGRLRDNLGRSLDRMLAFYGFARDGASGAIGRAANFAARSRNWLTIGNHNHLRLTRILDSLTLLSRPDDAVSVFGALDDVYRECSQLISPTTYEFWSKMAERAARTLD